MSIRAALHRFATATATPPPPMPRIEVREALGVRPISHTLNKPQWLHRSPDSYFDEGYSKLALVFRCIGVLSQAVASAPLAVYRTTPNGDEREEAHPLRQLMSAPNRESNEARFLAQVMMTAATAGFVVIEKERSTAGRVAGLWPLNPAYCRPIPRADNLPDWEIKVPGYEAVILAAQDVIAITYADRPDRSPTGIGPVEIVLREVALTNTMTDFLKAFFDSGAMPVYGLVPNPEAGEIDQAQADVIREAWRVRYGGMRGAVEPAILSGITDVKRLSFDFDELAWSDLRDLSDLAICQAFGIPPILVGTRYGLERSTFANYGEARSSFYEDTVSPLWNRIEDAFSRSLMPDFERRPGFWLGFDTSDVPAMREDIMPRRAWAVTALQAGGISTHQFARECGLEPAGPDVFLRSFATVEVPAMEQNGRRHALPRLLEDRAFTALERRNAIAQTSRAAYLRLAQRAEPELAAYLDGQKTRVVEASTRSGGLYETRDVASIDWAEEDRLLAEILQALHTGAGELAYRLAAQAMGEATFIAWTLTNPRIMDLLTELAGRVTLISDTTRLDISRVVTESLTEGVSMDQLADRLRGLYEETYQGRSMAIARTESQVAYNRAATLNYTERGIRLAQMYDNSSCDHRMSAGCSSCQERAGAIVPMTEVDHHINCSHPNCILAVAPYVDVSDL